MAQIKENFYVDFGRRTHSDKDLCIFLNPLELVYTTNSRGWKHLLEPYAKGCALMRVRLRELDFQIRKLRGHLELDHALTTIYMIECQLVLLAQMRLIRDKMSTNRERNFKYLVKTYVKRSMLYIIRMETALSEFTGDKALYDWIMRIIEEHELKKLDFFSKRFAQS